MANFEYCAAIRTLGTAGEKYLTTLKSLQSQTIPPKKILVYIAKGYPLPKETIGTEQYIYVNKGMVAQRALPYEEVDTDYILCLDDDLYFPPDMIEKLYKSLSEYNADCISPNIYPNHQGSLKWKLTEAFSAFTLPMHSDKWAFRIRKSGAYSYNNNPTHDAYLSQSASWACFLCKLSAFKDISFQDELWMDTFKYSFGDDQLFYYKLYINGHKVLVHYNTGIVHLSAKSSHIKNLKGHVYVKAQTDYIIWHRTCYAPLKGIIEKYCTAIAYICKIATKTLFNIVYGISKRKLLYPIWSIQGLMKGIRFTKSPQYRNLANFKIA